MGECVFCAGSSPLAARRLIELAAGCVCTVPGSYVPQSNGCGMEGLKLDVSRWPGMSGCCDSHDLCYSSCDSTKAQCDSAFEKFLSRLCKAIADGSQVCP